MNHATGIAIAVVVSFSLLGGPAARAADPATPAPTKEATGSKNHDDVQKTKTKSNQSNDREAAPPAASDTEATPTAPPAEALKTKTKSNQSND